MDLMVALGISKNINDRFAILGALSGILAPIIYSSTVFIAGALRPGYNHLTQYVSYLGAGNDSSAMIMNFGFLLFGILIILFGFRFYREIEGNRTLRIIFAGIIFTFGISTALFAFFPIDAQASMHDLLAKIGGAIYIAPWIAAILFKATNNWRTYFPLSILITIAIAVAAIVYGISNTEYVGLFQRIAFGLILIWVEVISLKLLSNR